MGKKRGCPSVGFPPVVVPDNWLHHRRGLALVPTFHLTTHCSTAGQEEHWQSRQEEKPGGSDPGSPAMQSNSDSASLWLVSFGPQIYSFFHNPAPPWGKVEKVGKVHKVGSCTNRSQGGEAWSGELEWPSSPQMPSERTQDTTSLVQPSPHHTVVSCSICPEHTTQYSLDKRSITLIL